MYININAVVISLNEINIIYFINLFTIINMLSNLTSYAESLNFNNFIMKFIIIDSQNTLNIFNLITSL